MMRYTEYVRTRVTEKQLKRLKIISRRIEKPIAEIMRDLVTNYIAEKEKTRK